MKTIKSLTAAFLIVFSFSAFANDGSSVSKNKMYFAVNSYIDAVNTGNSKELSNLLDAKVKYTMHSDNEVRSYNKSEFLEVFKSYEGLVQNCRTDFSVLEMAGPQAIVKISMKYSDFTKVNYVTFTSGTDGWKITNISASYN